MGKELGHRNFREIRRIDSVIDQLYNHRYRCISEGLTKMQDSCLLFCKIKTFLK
jgi:hypothetical protein